jgi:CubicO group peptidase (beta-lactamase class C family)
LVASEDGNDQAIDCSRFYFILISILVHHKNPSMKNSITLSLLFFLLIGCSKPKPTEPISIGPSVQDYSIPQFVDSIQFSKMKDAFPVIEKIYQDQMVKNNFPSIAFGVIANGQMIFSGSFGSTNIKDKITSNTKSLYRVASMSKSFTAMAILKLRDEGKLGLLDPVSKYIPEINKAGALTKDAPPINIQHLLTMSAGFPEDNPWGDRQLADPEAELLQLIGQGISFSNVPGVEFEYSNLGFALLGKIISNVSGMPYQKYITENILKPIGMNDSKWEYDEVPKEQLALGYRWEDETWKEEALLHDGSYGAMGGMICSIEDFSKYVSLHLNAWPPRNDEEQGPVKRSTIREMHQPWRFSNLFSDAKNRKGERCPIAVGYSYGLGWRKDCKGIVRISHSGGLPGFGSEWRILPEYGVGVVSFANRTYGAPGMANAMALDTLIHIAGLKPRTLPPSKILDQRKNEIVKIIQSWNENSLGIFAENFFLDLSKERWKTNTEKIFSEAGAVVSVTEMKPENQLRGSFSIVCEKKKVNVFFTLTPEAGALVQELNVWIGEN